MTLGWLIFGVLVFWFGVIPALEAMIRRSRR